MYRLLSQTTQDAPQKTNVMLDFIKNQPVLFGVVVAVGVLAIVVSLMVVKITQDKKRKRK